MKRTLVTASALLLSLGAVASVDFQGELIVNDYLNLTNKNGLHSFPGGKHQMRFSLKDSRKVTIEINNQDKKKSDFKLSEAQSILNRYPKNGPYNGAFSSEMQAEKGNGHIKAVGELKTDLQYGDEVEDYRVCYEDAYVINKACVASRELFRIQNRYTMSPRERMRHEDDDRIYCREKVTLPGDRLVITQLYAQHVDMDADLIDLNTGRVMGHYRGYAREDEMRPIYDGPCITEADLELRRRLHRDRDGYRNRRRNARTLRY